jgi:ABC-type glycerol-3-phosphate transport system permease component
MSTQRTALDIRGLDPANAARYQRDQIIRGATRAISYVLVTAGALTMAIPFFWMVSASFKTMDEIWVVPPIWIPPVPTLEPYQQLFQKVPFARYSWNSLYIAVLTTIGMVASCALGAYAFARLRFPGKTPLFALLLATMMVPAPITIIPTFLLFTKFGWVGTHLPLIVPAFFGGAFGTFLLRQFFLTIPSDLVDAARVDGANHFRIFISIFLPLSKPGLATLAVLVFVGSWNSFLMPLIYARREDLFTLTVGLSFLVRGTNQATFWNQVMAGSAISVLPMVIIFLLAQKYFVRGIVLSGMKG